LVPIASLVGRQPEVVTMDGWRVTTAAASKVWYTGHHPVYRLTTRSGRTIRATASHRFRVLGGWRALEDLSPGDRIALPRAYPEPREAESWDKDRLVLLPPLMGDGCYASRQPLHYTSASQANLTVVEDAARGAFGVQGRRVQQARWYHVYLGAGASKWHPNPIRVWLRALGIDGQRSHEKVIPAGVFCLPDREIALFLRHLWATDGSIYLRKTSHGHTGTIYYATSSRTLADQVQHLLARLGIATRILATRKGNYKPGYQIHVTGRTEQLRFATVVGAFGDRVSCLNEVVDFYSSVIPNHKDDAVPIAVWKEVQARMRAQGISQRQMAALRGTSYGGTSHFQFAPTRETLASYARILNDSSLQEVADSDVYWD